MNKLMAGFARANITPMLGIGVAGYFVPRRAEGVLDELEAAALALGDGGNRVLLIGVDSEGIAREVLQEFRENISRETGVPVEGIFIAATHTHTGPVTARSPFILDARDEELAEEYTRFLYRRLLQVSVLALEDMQPARMGYGCGKAPGIAYVRRFRMKDGSIRTNPGINNPDVLEPIGAPDDSVRVLRFDRQDGLSYVLVHYANHADTVGGSRISADWPGLTRRTVEKTLDNTRCIFFNGAEGDIGHVNVFPRGGFSNGMSLDFDDVMRGYGHARYMARVVTGGVLQAFDKVEYRDVDALAAREKTVRVPANTPDPRDLPLAHRYDALHRAGRDGEIPFKGMMLTTVVAEAGRMVRLEHGPAFFEIPMTAVRIGDIALVGVAGEPFTGIGHGLARAQGYREVLTCALTNGNEGYFPMREAYDEGGYEARSSYFQKGVAELLISEGNELLHSLRSGSAPARQA